MYCLSFHQKLKFNEWIIPLHKFPCSVGSLGQDGEEEFVEHVNVSNCTFNGADSAAKIKTWPVNTISFNMRKNYIIRIIRPYICIVILTNENRIQFSKGGKGYAKNITFQNISVNQTNYPIYISQHYMSTPEKVNIHFLQLFVLICLWTICIIFVFILVAEGRSKSEQRHI